jgi:5'-nucleotidase
MILGPTKVADLLPGRLTVGISSRALFDLSEANGVFEAEGLTAYRDYQRSHESEILEPGTGFSLVRGLLAINQQKAGLVEVVVFSKNSADSAMRVFKSIEAHGLAITRGIFRGGRDPWPFLPVFGCDLFLSAERDQVLKARSAGVAAALVMPRPDTPIAAHDSEVRIALDGDAVLFDPESERIYAEQGVEAFRAHEAANAEVPMEAGPFRGFLEGLARIQGNFPVGHSPLRTALVTARDAPAHYRVINTLRAWGIDVDETYFLGGVEKTETLAAFGAHIFFDDQFKHISRAASTIPSAHVLWPEEEVTLPVTREPLAPVPNAEAAVDSFELPPSKKRRRTKSQVPAIPAGPPDKAAAPSTSEEPVVAILPDAT